MNVQDSTMLQKNECGSFKDSHMPRKDERHSFMNRVVLSFESGGNVSGASLNQSDHGIFVCSNCGDKVDTVGRKGVARIFYKSDYVEIPFTVARCTNRGMGIKFNDKYVEQFHNILKHEMH